MHGAILTAYLTLVGNSEGKRLLGRPRYRCEDNIKLDPRETVCGVLIRVTWLRRSRNGGLL
jgi:hypothetical protein